MEYRFAEGNVFIYEMRGEEEDVMVETGLVLYFSLDLKHVFYAPRYGKTILPLYIDNLY